MPAWDGPEGNAVTVQVEEQQARGKSWLPVVLHERGGRSRKPQGFRRLLGAAPGESQRVDVLASMA